MLMPIAIPDTALFGGNAGRKQSIGYKGPFPRHIEMGMLKCGNAAGS